MCEIPEKNIHPDGQITDGPTHRCTDGQISNLSPQKQILVGDNIRWFIFHIKFSVEYLLSINIYFNTDL